MGPKRLLSILFLLIVVRAMGQEPIVAVTSPPQQQATPGAVVTCSAWIALPSSAAERAVVRHLLPEGWRVLSEGTDPLTIAPGEEIVDLFAIQIPPWAAVGCYPISLEVKSGEEVFSSQFFITVLPHLSLSAEVVDKPLFVISGEAYWVTLELHNEGNTPIPLYLEAETGCGFPCGISDSCLWLEEGERRTVQVAVQTPADPAHSPEHYLAIRGIDSETGERLFSKVVTVETLLLASNDFDPYVWIPIIYRGAVAGDLGRVFGIAEVSGHGDLDPAGERHLDFFYRLPTDEKNNTFYESQRLFYGLSSPNWDLQIGDTIYTLTPLTERWWYNRGAGAHFYQEQWEGGAFYAKDRFEDRYDQEDLAAYLKCYPTSSLSFSGNYLHKRLNLHPESNIFSLATEYAPSPYFGAYGEIAKNVSSPDGRDDHAFFLDLHADLPCFGQYNLEWIQAGSAFFGFYNDIDHFSASADIPWNCWQLTLSTIQLEQKVHPSDLDPRGRSDLNRREYRGRLAYHLPCGRTLAVHSQHIDASDDEVLNEYAFCERWAGVEFHWPVSCFDWDIDMNVGSHCDDAHQTSGKLLQRHYFHLHWRPYGNLDCRLRYQLGHTNPYDPHRWRYGLGGNLRYDFYKGRWAEIYGETAIHSPHGTRHSQIGGRYNQTFANGHNLYVDANYVISDMSKEAKQTHAQFNAPTFKPRYLRFLCGYIVPSALPVSRRHDVGSVSGTVLHQVSQMPISQTIVRVGDQRILTDSCGRFSLDGLLPGYYSIQLERPPEGLIPGSDEPLECFIYPDRRALVTLTATPTAAFCGQVILQLPKEEGNPLLLNGKLLNEEDGEMVGVSGCLITLISQNGKESFTKISQADGYFSFDGLRPGIWDVAIQPPDCYATATVLPGAFRLTLGPGQADAITIKLAPEVREIQLLD